ncbi:MAG: dimethyl sulfoxide reductase anchor subunit [Synoicihabitans sp.]
MIAPGKPPLLSLVDELLAEQQSLQTPVATFARHHPDTKGIPDLEPVYRDLIPLTAPNPGEQYAFEVDLDSCSGCKACVAGCHSLNGLDEEETWRDVGIVTGSCGDQAWQQTITSACHHCADPGCLNGCPVLAYEKDPITGIVSHLDDQCIGCSYCILKCPYDVPKYSDRLGIVRKCDMCQSRLAEGEAPACVQSCPTQAIKIIKVAVDFSGDRPTVTTDQFLSAAPDAQTTLPPTRYVSERTPPDNFVSGDQTRPEPQPAHWPLVFLLVFTQAALGFSIAGQFGSSAAWTWMAVAFATIGLSVSVAHLGRPLRAWRIFLGLRRSWLSREAVVLGAWFPALIATAIWGDAVPGLGLLGIAIGAVGVACSAMIYIDTPRRFWRAPATSIRMGGTVAIAATIPFAPAVATFLIAAKTGFELWQVRGSTSSAQLQRNQLRPFFHTRILLSCCALLGSVTIMVTLWSGTYVVVGIWLGGEILERYLYFRAVDSSKMPGVQAG